MAGTSLFGPVTSTLNACLTDEANLIYFGSCTGAPPTTASIFQIGCTLIQTDATNGGVAVFVNVGTTAAPSWALSTGALQKTVTLTTAQISTMASPSVELLPAPPSGTAYQINSAVFRFIPGGSPFTGGGDVQIQYHLASPGVIGANLLTSVLASPFIQQTTASIVSADASGSLIYVLASTAVDITNATASFSANAAATGTMKVYLRYNIVKL